MSRSPSRTARRCSSSRARSLPMRPRRPICPSSRTPISCQWRCSPKAR
jgi:hypothetical protein